MSQPEIKEADLPKANLKRLIKAKLQAVDKAKGGDGTRDFQVNKDALLAFGEAGKLFIHYLTAAANDNCKEAKRQTISVDDVVTALTDLEFGELVEPLKTELDHFRAENREKARLKAEESKKRKAETAAAKKTDAGATAGGEEGQGEGEEKRQKEDDDDAVVGMETEEQVVAAAEEDDS